MPPPPAEPDDEIVIVGNKPSLGNWQAEDAPRMKRSPTNPKSFSLTLANVAADPIEYKFVKVSDRQGTITWMGGGNLSLERTDVDIVQNYIWSA